MRWFIDTLPRRVFLLMWAALVVSHLAAYTAVVLVYHPNDPQPFARMPTFPSLPPMPGLGDRHPQREPEPPRMPPGHSDELGDAQPGLHLPGPPRGPAGEGFGGGEHRPWPAPPGQFSHNFLWLDFGVRVFVIALAAWWGSRWLSRPIQRLAEASEQLGQSMNRKDEQPPELDVKDGTREVRRAATVFNAMGARLHRLFAERGLLVSALSHDIRTPLTRLRMRLETVQMTPEQHRRMVADITEVNELVGSTLELFRGDTPAGREVAQNVDVAALLLALVDDLAEQGRPVSFFGDPAVAQVQPLALRRVFGNLIGNALRYGERADVRLESGPETVIVHVEDAGPGIPADRLDAVFQPFYRLEASRNRDTGGAGLGLYITRELLAGMGGTIELANRDESEGGGLRATVRIPR
ncbi:ATP-binding protein [Burkholderiaceae bacterium UC74_6]